jgi:Kef-type K+ transport system membrane component KefB/mannitol/fructose-specific phosphotransferase system IIA component (Ntr-type)
MSIELIHNQIISVGLLILFAFFGGKLARKFQVGEVVGQILGGLLAGPVLLSFINPMLPSYGEALSSLHFFTFIFLSIIVFGIGDEFQMKKLRRLGSSAIVVAFIQAFTTWLFIIITFRALDFSWHTSFIIGSIGIATAPAATFVIMNRLGITGRMRSMLGGIVVLDDVIEVIVFSITIQFVLILNRGESYTSGSLFYHLFGEISFALVLGILLFFVLKLIISKRKLNSSEKTGGPVLGSEFLSRLLSEMPGRSIETLIVVTGTVSVFIGIALHYHLPFLITAITAGVLIANFHSQQVLDSLRIENATSMYTLLFFALIGANANLEAFHFSNLIPIVAYVTARAGGKLFGTWIGCLITGQEKMLRKSLPKLMLPQAGVAAIEAFYVASLLGAEGEKIFAIIIPGIIIFEIAGVWLSEKTLLKWHSWKTGGGEFISEEDMVQKNMNNRDIEFFQLLPPECLHVPFDVTSKGEAIWKLIISLQNSGAISNPGLVLEKVLQREQQGGTTLGEGIAILHCRIPHLNEPVVGLGVLPRNHTIEFTNSGSIRVDIIYIVISPEEAPGLHLQILASIARFLSNKDLRTRLRYAENEIDAMQILQEHSDEFGG